MNPATGRPAEGLLSATVVAPTATLADGLSTALFVLGPERATALLARSFPAVDAVLVVPAGEREKARVLVTRALQGSFALAPEQRERYDIELF